MKRLKRIYTLTLTFLLISTLAQATVFETINGLKFSIDTLKNEATLVTNGSKGYSGDIVVPEKIAFNGKHYPVTSLGDKCFYDCKKLISITLPSSITSLENQCFVFCSNLKTINIPSSVKSLGNECFFGCSKLTSINIPSSVKSFGTGCFSQCFSLTSITIPSSLTSLSRGCFADCLSLTSITIPSSITSLGNNCFANCSELTSITIPSSVTSLGAWCFVNCSKLTSIIIPPSVTSLGGACFYGCSGLTSIDIPSSITSLKNSCFLRCKSLISITLPSSITSLENHCFEFCSNLKTINIPSSVKSLGDGCFFGCYELTSVDIPSSVTSLGIFCFSCCPEITSINIPSSVTSLGDYCFSGCLGLTSIDIPSTVTSLGWDCFDDCENLTSIIFHIITSPEYLYSFKRYDPSICKLYLPKKSIDKYKFANERKNFLNAENYQELVQRGDTAKCEVPSITLIDNTLHFSSATRGVQYHYTITNNNIVDHVYEISAYATSFGHADSDIATATLYWLPASRNNNIDTSSTRLIIATSNNGIITISGLNAHENVTFYSLSGKQLGTATAVDGTATYALNGTGDIVIAKFGGSSIKIATK